MSVHLTCAPSFEDDARHQHKTQGTGTHVLALGRVAIDAGDDESSVGLFFVAITRVRRIEQIAFDPMPDEARVASKIARKRPLWLRTQRPGGRLRWNMDGRVRWRSPVRLW